MVVSDKLKSIHPLLKLVINHLIHCEALLLIFLYKIVVLMAYI